MPKVQDSVLEQAKIEARFWAKVDKTDGCWLWKGSVAPNGYGKFGLRHHHAVYAHRYSYALQIGSIPDGLMIDHLCRNRACVFPAHMEPVTRKENLLRGIGFAAANARKVACPQGHTYDVVNTYYDTKGRRSCQTCSKHRRRLRTQAETLKRQAEKMERAWTR